MQLPSLDQIRSEQVYLDLGRLYQSEDEFRKEGCQSRETLHFFFFFFFFFSLPRNRFSLFHSYSGRARGGKERERERKRDSETC